MRLLLTEYHSWSDILSDLRLNICNMVFIILIIPEHVQREIISVQFGAHKLVPFYNNFRFKKRQLLLNQPGRHLNESVPRVLVQYRSAGYSVSASEIKLPNQHRFPASPSC